MLNFNAHLGFQFTELPFLQRFAAASQVGFKAVEFLSPYAYDASVLGDLLQEHKLKLVQFAAPAGETKGPRSRSGERRRVSSWPEGYLHRNCARLLLFGFPQGAGRF